VGALQVAGALAQLLEARRGRERCGGHGSFLSVVPAVRVRRAEGRCMGAT
jgi:hypothetical protein